MTKNYFFIFLLSLLTTVAVNAKVALMPPPEVPLEVSKINPTVPDGPHKGPVQVPEVSLDDHTLYFFTPCDGCTLNLVDENDDVVYTLVIPSGTTSLALPSDLSGEYELQIIRGNYCFWGTITL